MKYTVVQTPRGAKDILPREAYVKSRLEQRAAAYLESWGYARVYTPTFEFFDAIAQGDGPVLADSLYRFVDRDGAALALRPDMTIPIARMVATRYQPEDMPLRLYYVGNVFRYAEPQAGRYREFTQVGVELIGAAGPRADAEVVAVAAGVLESLGLASFRLDLGHVGYLRGLVEAVPDGRVGDGLKEALLRRDYVRYEALVNQCGLDACAGRRSSPCRGSGKKGTCWRRPAGSREGAVRRSRPWTTFPPSMNWSPCTASRSGSASTWP